MISRSLLTGLLGGTVGAAAVMAGRKYKGSHATGNGAMARQISIGVAAGAVTGAAVDALIQLPDRVATLETLMPEPQSHSTYKQVVKPTPDELFSNKGSGTDFETRLSTVDGYLTPNDRFYIRSHSPTPKIDVATWRLTIDGSGVQAPLELTYDELCGMPQTTVVRTLECAGNGRRFFKEAFGIEGEGGQWRTGAIGAAEWTGVRLREVLERARLTTAARDVMPEGLDSHHVRRPMPLEKALRDDTLLVLKMNGETLPLDHGFPARVLVPGWTGTASIKWVGRIQVSEKPLHSSWNTVEYVLVGPHYPTQYPALGPSITEMPVMSVIDLDWPARVPQGSTLVQGRAFAGEGRARAVEYSVDNQAWRNAELVPPNIEGSWVRWKFHWSADPGDHKIRIRATDDVGRTQPESVPWNHHGYLYNAIVAHPVYVQ